MVVDSMVASARFGAFGAAALAAVCAFTSPVRGQANDKMTPIAIPDQPNAIEIGTGDVLAAVPSNSNNLLTITGGGVTAGAGFWGRFQDRLQPAPSAATSPPWAPRGPNRAISPGVP